MQLLAGILSLFVDQLSLVTQKDGRSQWPRVLRRRSKAYRVLRL